MKRETIKIEKGVPIPEYLIGSGKGRKSKYDWASMKVGDSFITRSSMNSVKGAFKAWVKRHDPKRVFVAEKKTKRQVRVWRLK